MDVGLVCDGCSAFNELGSVTCASCQCSISLDADGPSAMPSSVEDDLSCPTCRAGVVAGNRFCGACGTPLPEPGAFVEETRPQIPPDRGLSEPTSSGGGKRTLFFSSLQAAKAKLVLIKGEGFDGESYALAGNEHRIGRGDTDIVFEEDVYLSPTHVNFLYVAGKLVARDEGSVNGVYLRIRGRCPIEFGDRFLVGEQVMEVQPHENNTELIPTPDGTYLYTSPRRPAPFRVVQILHGGSEGLVHVPNNSVASMGREGNSINFPEDPFISGHHAQIVFDGGQLALEDLGSKNGTFVRIREDTPLEHGDYVFMGQQLMRVEIV